jgi:hypothetical protein
MLEVKNPFSWRETDKKFEYSRWAKRSLLDLTPLLRYVDERYLSMGHNNHQHR